MSLAEIFAQGGKKKKKRNAASVLFEESKALDGSQLTQKIKQSRPQEEKQPPQSAQNLQNAAATREDADQRTLFVGNLSLTTKQLPKKLKRHFATYGDVESVRLRSLPSAAKDNAPKRVVMQNRRFKEDGICNAYIVFKTSESAEAARVLNMTQFQGKTIRVDAANQSRFMQPRKRQPSDPGNFTQRDSIVVKKLHKDVADEELVTLFNNGTLAPLCEGMVRNWRIVRDHRTGDGKGYAFVAFKTTAAAKAACTLDGHTLRNRKISVESIQQQRKPGRRPKPFHLKGSTSSIRWNQRLQKIGGSKKKPSWGGVQTKGRFKLRKRAARAQI